MAKIRKGFVSNSSSSSFVIVGNGEFEQNMQRYVDDDGTLVVGANGVTEFGWEDTKYRDMFDRINFAYMIAKYEENPEWFNMLETVLKEHFKCSSIFYLIDESYSCDENESTPYGKWVYGYIDHQSTAAESSNGSIYDSADELERFLFCKDSYIQGDNDNH